MLEPVFSLTVVGIMFIFLILDRYEPVMVLFAALAVLTAGGIITVEEALAGLTNRSVLTIASLFIIVNVIQRSGLLVNLAQHLFGRCTGGRKSQLKMMLPITALSAFINNTPLVAMFIPLVRQWALESRVPPSKYLIPLSYASIFGGLMTLVGTSTNLIVSGLLQQFGQKGLGMFETGSVGLPLALVGIAYMVLVGHHLLPANLGGMQEGFPKAQVPGGVTAESAPGISQAGGPAARQSGGAAVGLNVERLQGKVASIQWVPGEALLLRAGKNYRYLGATAGHLDQSRPAEACPPPSPFQGFLAAGILVLAILLATFNLVPLLHSAFIGLLLLFLTGAVTVPDARKAIDWKTIWAVVFSLGIGTALMQSGAAQLLASRLALLVQRQGTWGLVLAVYLVTALLTEVITNNAAAVLAFPIALATSAQMGVDPRPAVIAVTIAASASFSTPIGYQTNLMVLGPGGYKFRDFLRVGLPLNLIFLLLSVLLIPAVWGA